MKTILALIALAAAAPALARAPDYPTFQHHPVMDAAGIVPDDDEQRMDDRLATFAHDTGRQILVVTVPSLGDTPIEDYALGIGRKLGIGERDVNDGVIIVVAPAEHKARIEVGPGLQPYLTDALSSVIINDDMIPHFKAKDWAGGIQAGIDDVVRQVSPDAIARRQEVAKAANAAHIRTMAKVDTFLSWLGMTVAGALAAAAAWWVATRKKRRLKREEAERQAAQEATDRAERTRQAGIAAANTRREQAERDAETARQHAAMLASETPAQRRARQDREAAAAAAATAAAAAETERRRKARQRQDEEDASRQSTSSSWSGGYTPTPTPTPNYGGYSSGYDSTPTPTPTPDFSGGGGSFDGGGSTGSW